LEQHRQPLDQRQQPLITVSSHGSGLSKLISPCPWASSTDAEAIAPSRVDVVWANCAEACPLVLFQLKGISGESLAKN
jgi:hypothetical protein